MIIERILPINYYNELSGLMTDSSIVLILIKDNFPEIYDYLESNNGMIYLNNAINKWLLTIFIHRVSEVYSRFILDMFLLEGNIIIFKALYAIMTILVPHIKKCKNYDDLNNVFHNFPSKLENRPKLAYYLISKKFNFNMDLIKKYRKETNKKIIQEIKGLGDFLKEEEEKINKKNGKKLECDLDRPLCIKDKKNLLQNYDHIVLKELFEPNVIEDYIDKYEQYKDDIKIDKNNEKFEDLLIERRKHNCDSKKRSIRDNILKNNEKDKEMDMVDLIIDDMKYEEEDKEENNNELEDSLLNDKNNKNMNTIIQNIAKENLPIINFVKEKDEENIMSYD